MGVTGNGKLTPRNRIQHFNFHYGTYLHFFFTSEGTWKRKKIHGGKLSNVMAVKHECYLSYLRCFMSDYQ